MALRTACTYLRRLAQQIAHKQHQSAIQHTHKVGISTTDNLKGVYEPDGLGIGPEIPEYKQLILHLKGYDIAVLENYTRHISYLFKKLDFDVEYYPLPNEIANLTTFIKNTNKVNSKYTLNKYVRVFELNDLPSTKLPLLMDIVQSNVATGVEVSVKEWTGEDLAARYMPDRELEKIDSQLAALRKK